MTSLQGLSGQVLHVGASGSVRRVAQATSDPRLKVWPFDFSGGDARTLCASIQKIFALPDATRLFLCHDYKAPGRDRFVHETTVAAECQQNIHVHDGIDEDAFVKMRSERDATLSMPHLILPSVQVNMRAGELPPAEDNGVRYLKLPLDVF